MNSNPLVSVIMPIYNCASFIEDAVNSVLNQTLIDFEFIIIDDASTDDTLSVVQKITDTRIKIIKKEQNLGLVHSLNLGFEIAKGKYIARMDGDDISFPERFEKQVAVLNKNPEIKACGCWLKEFGWSNKIIKHKEYHDEIVANLLVGCSMSMGTVMLDRKWVENVLFDETKKHVEDYDFWSRVAWTGKLYNIQEILYYYRIHSDQVSTFYKNVQKKADISIKLFLFKKIDYKSNLYTDELISKMLLLDAPITLADFGLFLKWLKKLVFLNRKSKIYSQIDLENVLKRIKRALLFELYFKKTTIGITKKWRIMALFKLNIQDASYILKIKSRELRKVIEKAK